MPQIIKVDSNVTKSIRSTTKRVGYSPYLGEDGCWYEFDDTLGVYVDTGKRYTANDVIVCYIDMDENGACSSTMTLPQLLSALDDGKMLLFEYKKKLHSHYSVVGNRVAIQINFTNIATTKVTTVMFQIHANKVLTQTVEAPLLNDDNVDEIALKYAIKDTSVDVDKVELSDTSEHKLLDLKVYGNCSQTQTYGVNKFDMSKATLDKYITKDTLNTIGFTGTMTSPFIEVVNGAKYTITFKLNNTNRIWYNVYGVNTASFPLTNAVVYKQGDYTREFSFTFTTSTDYVVFSFGASDNTYTNLEYIQLEKGSAFTKYYPYDSDEATPNINEPKDINEVSFTEVVTHGKNLIPFNISNQQTNRPLSLKEGTYTISTKSDNTLAIRFNYYDGTSLLVNNISQTNSCTFTLTKYVTSINHTVKTNNVIVEGLQLEKGNKATSYEPYQKTTVTLPQAIVLRGIDDYKDVLDLGNGVIKRKINKGTLSGDENFRNDVNYDGYKRYYLLFPIEGLPPCLRVTMRTKVLSNRFKFHNNINCISNTFTYNGEEETDNRLYFYTDILNLGEFRQWIKANNVEYMYIMNDTVDEAIPTATLKLLKQLTATYGTCYLTTNSSVSPTLEVSYVKDTKLYIDNKLGGE